MMVDRIGTIFFYLLATAGRVPTFLNSKIRKQTLGTFLPCEDPSGHGVPLLVCGHRHNSVLSTTGDRWEPHE